MFLNGNVDASQPCLKSKKKPFLFSINPSVLLHCLFLFITSLLIIMVEQPNTV